jgi:hypothetical protein
LIEPVLGDRALEPSIGIVRREANRFAVIRQRLLGMITVAQRVGASEVGAHDFRLETKRRRKILDGADVVSDLIPGIAALQVSLDQGRLQLDCPVELRERSGIVGPVGVQATAIHVRRGEIRGEFEHGVVVGERLPVIAPFMEQLASSEQQSSLTDRRPRPARERLIDLHDCRPLGAAPLGSGSSRRARQAKQGASEGRDDRQAPVVRRAIACQR